MVYNTCSAYQEPSHTGFQQQPGACHAQRQRHRQHPPRQQPRPHRATAAPLRNDGMEIDRLHKEHVQYIHPIAQPRTLPQPPLRLRVGSAVTA